MTEDDIIFDDVYELCEVISKYVFDSYTKENGLNFISKRTCYDLLTYTFTYWVVTTWHQSFCASCKIVNTFYRFDKFQHYKHLITKDT